MLIGFPPIFVAETKIIYGYNFVAPLSKLVKTDAFLTCCRKKFPDSSVGLCWP